MAALAALAALLWPQRFDHSCTPFSAVGMNVSRIQRSSSITLGAGAPLISAWNASGYWVALWFAPDGDFLNGADRLPAFGGRLVDGPVVVQAGHGSEALCQAQSGGAAHRESAALVLAGLPTTRTRISDAAWSLRALPCTVKMAPLALSEIVCVPCPWPRGRAPTEQRPVGSCKGFVRVVAQEPGGQQRKGTVIQLHGDALQGLERRADLQQLQHRRLVWAKQVAVGESGRAARSRMFPAAPVTLTRSGFSSIFSLSLIQEQNSWFARWLHVQ
jgi:hypothetical protein